MTGDCSVCGPAVELQSAGRVVACRAARREARREYKLAHPQRAIEQRKSRSAHRLTGRDGDRATCAVCGPVTAVPQGRGYMCGTRAAELGWSHTATPQTRCPKCETWLRADGVCTRCRQPMFAGDAVRYAEVETGMSLVLELPLSSRAEYAVPGWRVMGSLDPVGVNERVKPEYARLHRSGG